MIQTSVLSGRKSHLCDQRLQQGGGAFPDAAYSKPEAAAAALHDPVISLVSVQSLRQHGPDLQVSHMSSDIQIILFKSDFQVTKERRCVTSWMTF